MSFLQVKTIAKLKESGRAIQRGKKVRIIDSLLSFSVPHGILLKNYLKMFSISTTGNWFQLE